jgi:hypothetical protein
MCFSKKKRVFKKTVFLFKKLRVFPNKLRDFFLSRVEEA